MSVSDGSYTVKLRQIIIDLCPEDTDTPRILSMFEVCSGPDGSKTRFIPLSCLLPEGTDLSIFYPCLCQEELARLSAEEREAIRYYLNVTNHDKDDMQASVHLETGTRIMLYDKEQS